MIEVWRIQFDSNFVKQFPPPRDLLWIETIRSDQVDPNLHASLGPRDLEATDTSGQIKKVILRIRMDKKKRRRGKGEDVRPNFVSRRSLVHNLQPSLRVWVSVNSGYEPTECSSGSSSCRRGSRNWRSSLVKILTLGGKLGAVASRKELQLNSQEKRKDLEGKMRGREACLNHQPSFRFNFSFLLLH